MGKYEVNAEPIEILLVEDDAGDVRLTREALKDAKVLNTLHVARDGEEAMDFLRDTRGYMPTLPGPTSSFSMSTCPGKTAGRCSRR